MTENKIFATDFNCTFKVLDDFLCFLKERKQRFTRGYKRYKETSGLIEWKECQIFHSIFT